MNEQDSQGGADQVDRRNEQRHITTYRPCCIEAEGGAYLGIIRNISPGGVQIETTYQPVTGQHLTYFWDGGPAAEAEVAWCADGRLGLRNITVFHHDADDFPPRAIRIPTDLRADIWIGDDCYNVGVANISQSGLLAYGLPAIPDCGLMSVELENDCFPNASLRWCRDGSAGIKFERPIPLKRLRAILERNAERTENGAAFDGSVRSFTTRASAA
ncbi:PilZ domain-containing protein [Altericroceibacterium endophyticum]|uniref:PilZ domain-containing protein n=1 Tax=Altericroceibacterium endophyticum TaxID=1808508 RepID=A0A6I4T5J2_9SPHN|nr:PilZ domain-containing protein [Altericroceibacterium endophyticum]MXO66127.1 hypothetical protein [Altericroceibacterium endophyticum]